MIESIRNAIKDAVRARDGHRCTDCGITGPEHAARITGPGSRTKTLHVHRLIADGAYSLENCKTVCPTCHCKYRRDYLGLLPKRPRGSVSREERNRRELQKDREKQPA